MDNIGGRSMNGNNPGRYGGGGNDFGGGLDSFGYPSQQHAGMNSGGGGGGQMAGQTIDGSTLWMGNIDEMLNENTIKYAFESLNIVVTNVKIIRNKDDGAPAGYGFVTFEDRNIAQRVLHELNGKKIPGVEEDKRFFLKRANRTQQKLSIFVGNLAPEITNQILHQAFVNCYPSTISARVITSDGQSKGFGFVEFGEENDYYAALNHPNMMLGSNPISISKARHSNNAGGGSGGGGGGSSGGGGYPYRSNDANGRYGQNNDYRMRRY